MFERPAAQDLKRASVRGGVNTMLAEGIVQALRLAAIVILARFLMPEHFGLIGMVTALTSVAERFKDLGLDFSTLQSDHITHEQVSTLFWINAGFGILIALLVAVCAPGIAWFYGEPRLTAIAAVLGMTFVFGGFTIQHQALMRRQMRFGALAQVYVLATTVSSALGVVLAWCGFAYWALVWKEVAQQAVSVAGVWIWCRWVPGVPRWRSGIWPMLKVGGSVTGYNLVTFLSRSLDQIVIGKQWGAGPLGYYRQGYQLILPLYLLYFPVNHVAVPALSALHTNGEKYKAYYREMIALIALVCVPAATYLAVNSEIVVRLVLGEKWLPSAPILRVLALAGGVSPLVITSGTVMITCGRTTRYFWLGMGNAVTLAISLLIGARWSPYGVAVAYAVWAYVTLIPSLWISFRGTPVDIMDTAGGVAQAALSAAVMAVGLSLLPAIGGAPIVQFIWTFAAGAAIYTGTLCLLPGGRADLLRRISYASSLYANNL